MQVLCVVELQRDALTMPEIRMEVDLNDDYSLLAKITIHSTMIDMKLREEQLGLGLTTISTVSTAKPKNREMVEVLEAS